MKITNQILLITLSISLSLGLLENASAQELKKPWSGKAGLGYLSTDGNSESSSLNSNLALAYEIGRWHHGLSALAISGSSNDVTTAERYALKLKSDFDINTISYFFALAEADKDRFSAYDLRTTQAVGYGRHLLKTDTQMWKIEIGAGVTQLKPVLGPSNSDAIVRLATDYRWKFSETADFTQKLSVESGETNTYLESTTSLKATVYKNLGLRLSYSLKNNSDVPPGVEKTDTFTAISLEYSF